MVSDDNLSLLEKKERLHEVASCVRRLRDEGYKVSLHPHIAHVFPSSHVELLRWEHRTSSVIYSKPIVDFQRDIYTHIQNRWLASHTSKLERQAKFDAMYLLRKLWNVKVNGAGELTFESEEKEKKESAL